jgi:hypothetical protein
MFLHRALLLQVGAVVASATAPPSADELVYNHGGANATNRSLADVLRERVSVRDFGAVGNCGSPDAAPARPVEVAVGRTVISCMPLSCFLKDRMYGVRIYLVKRPRARPGNDLFLGHENGP